MPRFHYAGQSKVDQLCLYQNLIKNNMKQSQTPIISFSPVVLPVSGRHVDLEMKVSAPASGNNLPVILISHGHGPSNFLSSYKGYAPIVDFFAAKGFVVIQPTHQNSKILALPSSLPEAPLFWSSRATDMTFILDHLDEIISTVPGLTGRIDKAKIGVIGHSMGGQTVAMLSGMEVTDPATGKIVNAAEPRLKARVLIGASGGPEGFNGAARQHYPVLAAGNFGTMTLPALIVNGDKDINLMFSDVDNCVRMPIIKAPVRKTC
jgi:predicted dienelactone hydrolase